jgi:5-methylcytosine-specific restriction endonuclease McrA
MEEENLAEKLFKLNASINQWLTDTKAVVSQIKARQDPRRQFDDWRDSDEGKNWKRRKYEEQERKCALCGSYVNIHHAHIDHIKPIIKYPDLALNLHNLQLVHPKCNKKKGVATD